MYVNKYYNEEIEKTCIGVLFKNHKLVNPNFSKKYCKYDKIVTPDKFFIHVSHPLV